MASRPHDTFAAVRRLGQRGSLKDELMNAQDPRDESRVPVVLLLSAQRSRNLGDWAMLDSARAFIAESFGANVEMEVYGAQDSPTQFGGPGVTSHSSLLVRIKKWVVQRRSDSSRPGGWGISADGVRGPLGWGIRLVLAGWFAIALLLAWLRRRLRLPVPKSVSRVCRPLDRVSAVVTTGGGWLNSNFILTLYEHLHILLAARLIYRIPVFIVGEQVGPLQHRLDRFLVRVVFDRAQLIALRDQRSVVLARTLTRQPECVRLFCDWAYRWQETGISRTDGPPRLGVNLRRAHYSPFSSDELIVLARVLDDIHQETGAELHFIPICFDSHESDDLALSELRDRCASATAITLHTELSSPHDCISLVGMMDLNISVSYHLCLFSLMTDVPCLGIATSDYYAVKLGGLLELFDAADWLVRAPQLEVGPFLDKLRQHLSDSASHRERLRDVNRRLIRQRQDEGRHLRELLATSLSQSNCVNVLDGANDSGPQLMRTAP